MTVPTLLRTKEAAKVLNVTDGTMRYWRAVGIGPRWIKIEGGVRYDLADLLECIERGRRNPSVRAYMEDHDVRQ
jgi:DNA-binding transcriptional MerR regulator